MCVHVFLADDAAVMRSAIRTLLSDREDMAVAGEASNFRETIQKTAELHPDLIILDDHLAESDKIATTKVKCLLNGAKILAITLGADEIEQELLSENRIEEFKNGFAADRLSCHRFRANALRLLLHYNLVNLFRLQLPSSMRSAQIETLRVHYRARSSPLSSMRFPRYDPHL